MAQVSQVRNLHPSAPQITDATEKSHYWTTVLQYWKLPAHIQHFPGANPMSIEKSDFDRLETDDFLAALKSDGVRYLFLLTTKPNSADPIAIMIDRTKTMYEVEIWANEDFFQRGSLYDGELVWERNTLMFLVFDVMFAKGVRCSRLSYRERMQIVHTTILCVSSSHSDPSVEKMIAEENKFLARNNIYDLVVLPKKTVPKAQFNTLWQDRTNIAHQNDGVIFTQNNAPINTGTSPSILKWKPEHSVDVRVVWVINAWKLYANENQSGDMKDITNYINGRHVELSLDNKLLDAIKDHQPCIVECVVTVQGDRIVLTPERERSDKLIPNSMKTITSTVRNVEENIACSDLVKLLNAVE